MECWWNHMKSSFEYGCCSRQQTKLLEESPGASHVPSHVRPGDLILFVSQFPMRINTPCPPISGIAWHHSTIFQTVHLCVKKGVKSRSDDGKMALQKEDFPRSIHRFPVQFSYTTNSTCATRGLISVCFSSLMGVVWIPMVNLFENWDGFLDERLQKTMPHSTSFLVRPDIIPLFVLLKWKTCTVSRDQWSTCLDKRHPRVSSQKFIGFVNCKWFSSIENENGSCGLLFHPWFLWLEDHMSFQRRQASMMILILIFSWWIFFDDGCLQYKRMTCQSCTINNSKYLYILHSFTSRNKFKVKPHFVFHCFRQKNTMRLHLHTRHESFRKFQKFQVPWSPRPRNPSSRHVLGDSTREVWVFAILGWGWGGIQNGRLEWK